MVDLQNPTNQFHSYQPPDATPRSEETIGRWGMLRKVGLKESQINDLTGSWNRIRDYARHNPGKVLGGMAALVVAAGLLGMMASRRK